MSEGLSRLRRWAPWLIAAVILLTDRLSKMAILAKLPHGAEVPVFPGLSISHVHNPGIAFGMLQDLGQSSRSWLLVVVTLAIAALLVVLLRQSLHRLGIALCIGAILGGAIGNLIDRLLYGYVIDFVHCWIRVGDRVFAWPDFNVADSAISVGAVFLLIAELRSSNEREPAEAS